MWLRSGGRSRLRSAEEVFFPILDEVSIEVMPRTAAKMPETLIRPAHIFRLAALRKPQIGSVRTAASLHKHDGQSVFH